MVSGLLTHASVGLVCILQCFIWEFHQEEVLCRSVNGEGAYPPRGTLQGFTPDQEQFLEERCVSSLCSTQSRTDNNATHYLCDLLAAQKQKP